MRLNLGKVEAEQIAFGVKIKGEVIAVRYEEINNEGEIDCIHKKH